MRRYVDRRAVIMGYKRKRSLAVADEDARNAAHAVEIAAAIMAEIQFDQIGGLGVRYGVDQLPIGFPAKTVELAFRYALAGSARPLLLSVNGVSQKLVFDDSGGWTTWKDWSIKVPFKAGKNSIRLETLDKSGGNIDHLQVIE